MVFPNLVDQIAAEFTKKGYRAAARNASFCAASVRSRTAHQRNDHLGDILAVLNAEQFQRCFVAWVAALTGAPEGVLAIDGKTLRRSGRKNGCNPAIHIVSAFAARQRLVLGQVKVAEKSNEIIAIPKLLYMLAIEGTIVTIDAMGCQRNIAEKIVDRKADYVLALKGNQGSLREDVELFVAEQKAAGFRLTPVVVRTGGAQTQLDRIEQKLDTILHRLDQAQPGQAIGTPPPPYR